MEQPKPVINQIGELKEIIAKMQDTINRMQEDIYRLFERLDIITECDEGGMGK